MRKALHRTHHFHPRRKHMINQGRAGDFYQGKSKAQEEFEKKSHEEQSQYSMACSVQKLAARFFPFHFLCAFENTQGNSHLSIGRPHMFSCRAVGTKH